MPTLRLRLPPSVGVGHKVCSAQHIRHSLSFAHRRLPGSHLSLVDTPLLDYTNFHEVYQGIGCFPDHVCQRKRIHSALGYLTPVESEAQWLEQQPVAASMKIATP